MTMTEESRKPLQGSSPQTQHALRFSSAPKPGFIRFRIIIVALLVLIVGMVTMRISSPLDVYRIFIEAPMRFSRQPSWDGLKPGGLAIGIDFGTENVRVALEINKTMTLLPTKRNSNVMPDWMQFRSSDISFTIAEDQFHQAAQASPTELMSLLFKEIKRDAEAHFEVPVGYAVVSVPTYFNDAKRQAVKDAGRLSGIQVLRVANDPTLAGIAYNLDKRPGEQYVLVVDYGFNLDVSLILMDDGVFEIIATSGKSAIGTMDSGGPMNPAFHKSLTCIDEVLKEANITKDQIDDVLLLGGGSQNPALLAFLSEHLGKEPTSSNFSPSEAIVRGAAILGGIITGGDSDLCTCCPLDINTLTLGVETVGGFFTPMIQRNNVLPVRRQMNFSTTTGVQEDQLEATIKVYEGERGLTTHNRLLGSLDLGALKPSSSEGHKIQITMEVNSTNDVSIEAKYLDSGKMATLVIKEEERLSYNRNPQSSDVIEAMILDAESNIEIDEAIRNFLGLAILHGTLVESSRRGSDGVVYSVDGEQVPLQEEPTHHRVSVYQDALEWLENFGHSASLEELKAKHEAMQTPAVSLSFPEQVGLPKIQLKIRQPRLA